MEIKADSKLEERKQGDIFVTVHKNNHQCGYLIGQTKSNTYTLTNLNSGYTNYEAQSIEALIELYLSQQDNKINPITHYYFIKPYHVTLDAKKTFGHTKV